MICEDLPKIINEEIMHNKHKHDNNEVRIAILETTSNHIYKTLERIEKRFDVIDHHIEKIDEKLVTMEKKIDDRLKTMDVKMDSINNRLWTNFYWILGAIGLVPFGMKFVSKWLGI